MTASAHRQGYHILDEPRPGGLSQWTVEPLWPLLAIMVGGVWLSWPWFVFNSLAVGSPTRRREIAWAVGGLAGTFALVLGLFALISGVPELEPYQSYLLVSIFVWKALVSYRLYLLQSRTFEIYQYFDGPVRNGLILVAAGWFLRPHVLGALPMLLKAVLA